MKDQNHVSCYDDIIDLPHHTSKTRNRMSLHDRAAQFSPFAALTGHDAAIKETARLTDQRVELDEEEKARLNDKIGIIAEHAKVNPEVTIMYFQPDEKKAGGEYITHSGFIKKFNIYERLIIMQDGTHIPMDDILDIRSELLSDFI